MEPTETLAYTPTPEPKWYQVVAITVVLFAITFGLAAIGLLWTSHEVNKLIIEEPTPAGVIELDADESDLPLQRTVDGTVLQGMR